MEIEGLGHTITFEGGLAHEVFSENLLALQNQDDKHDRFNEYSINSLKFRSPEFTKEAELLVAGCSYTYGVGLSENTIWGKQLADMHNLPYSNLSMPGASVDWLVDQLFSYFLTYGNPKNLAVLFPNVYRGICFLDGEITSGGNPHDHESLAIQPYSPITLNPDEYPKLSKRPHDIHEIGNPKLNIYRSIKAIRTLEQYASQANINFKWAVFEAPSELFLRDVEKYFPFKNRVDLGRSDWAEYFKGDVNGFFLRDYSAGIDQFKKCCEDKKEWAGDAFDLATDRDSGLDRAHPGVHSHIHTAKDFSKAMFPERQD